MPLRITFARLVRETRTQLGLTQRQIAQAVGVSRGYVANLESGRANPTLDLVERVAVALGIDIGLMARPPTIVGGRSSDLVHARCSGYADRRLRSQGWLTAREVEVVHARSHGWIDLLAFDPTTALLLIIEIKTSLSDMGAIERQLGWYERSGFELARRLGWHPRRIAGWLLVLASEDVEGAIRSSRELLATAFPVRAIDMLNTLESGRPTTDGRGIALIDPTSKRRAWLMRSRIDGRRSAAPYRDYGEAARRLAA